MRRQKARLYLQNPSLTDFLQGACPILSREKQPGLRQHEAGFFDASHFGANTFHQHEDKLNLLIFNSEKCLLVESGKYAYDSSYMRKYSIMDRSHNVVRVNGNGQNRKQGYKWLNEYVNRLSELKFNTNSDYDIAYGCYDEGFGDDQLLLAKHERTVVFYKNVPIGKPLFAVKDVLTSDKVNEYEFMWHFDVENPRLNGADFTSDEISAFICGEVGNSSIVSGIDDEMNTQGWVCSNYQGAYRAIPTLIHKVIGDRIETITLFSIHEEGKSPVLSASYDNGCLLVKYIDGNTVTVKFEF